MNDQYGVCTICNSPFSVTMYLDGTIAAYYCSAGCRQHLTQGPIQPVEDYDQDGVL